MLIDSIMGTIDHIYCDNTFHVITEQNHRRNTIVRRANASTKGDQVYSRVMMMEHKRVIAPLF
jgi:hypothetical protein